MKRRSIPLARSSVWRLIRQLDLPSKTKTQLRKLWRKSRVVGEALVAWVYHHRVFSSTVMLGVAVAYLVGPLPMVGEVLGNLSVSLSVLWGMIRQFEADLHQHFHVVTEGGSL